MAEKPQARNYPLLVIAILVAGIVIAAAIAGSLYLGGRTTITELSSVTQTSTTTAIIASDTTPFCNLPVWNINAPLNGSDYPALLMQPDSTAYVCVTYQSAWQGNVTEYQTNYSNLNSYQFSLSISKELCGNSNGCGPADFSNFAISGALSVRPIAGFDYLTVVYTVTARGNSTGFYANGIPAELCNSVPLAVGYKPSQVNGSDFEIIVPSCPSVPAFSPVAASVGGMVNMTYIAL